MTRSSIILNIMEKTLQEEKRRTGPNEGLTYKTLKTKISEQGVTESEFASIKKLVNLKLKKNDLELQMGTIKENMDVNSGKLGKVDNEIIQEYKNIDERILTNIRLRNMPHAGKVDTGGPEDNAFRGFYEVLTSMNDPVRQKDPVRPKDPWLTIPGTKTKGRGGRKTRRRRKRKRTRRRRTRTRRKRTRRRRNGGKKTRRIKKQIGCRKN